jgi:hypothetical protein
MRSGWSFVGTPALPFLQLIQHAVNTAMTPRL